MVKRTVNKGARGASFNPPNRFETLWVAPEIERTEPEDPLPGTVFLKEKTKSIISYNDSPDVGFDAGVNPYRGCEHGCVYCYARPSHEYMGFSAGTDFEAKIVVKHDAPHLLRKELMAKRWQPQTLALSGNTDCYQPGERRFRLTRECLKVLAEFRNPVAIVTKNFLVTRDIDVLQALAKYDAVAVFVSITSLDDNLSRLLEPRASRPKHRLAAVTKLREAGIPAGIMLAPVIPTINEAEIPAILNAAKEAGAMYAHYTMLRLSYSVKDLFSKWLETHFPERQEKVLNRLLSLRGGKLNDSTFGRRMRGEGNYAQSISSLFALAKRRAGFDVYHPPLSTEHFRRPGPAQLSLF